MISHRIRRIFSTTPLFSCHLSQASGQQLSWKQSSRTLEGINPVEGTGLFLPSSNGQFDTLAWKVVDSRAFGIEVKSVLHTALMILRTLQKKGFVAYLVGGCVRDLLLKRTPKDFDVITTASLKQIKMCFRRCNVIGSRFPICLVHISGNVIEVSSFNTTARNRNKCEAIILPEMPNNGNVNDFECWKNCMKRDFTINSLFFDPFKCKIYDYVGGIQDLRALKVRTIIPPHSSFKEDCARILRGVRVAARLGLRFSRETIAAIQYHSSSILTLNKPRLMMEMNFIMAYGAAASSIHLLRKFKLLELLLPAHAAYLSSQFSKPSPERSIMLIKLLVNADKLLKADRPCSCTLWLGLLAFHLALVNYPQDARVIWTFASILFHGRWNKAAKESSSTLIHFVPETLPPSQAKSVEVLLEETSHLISLLQSSVKSLTNSEALQKSLAKYGSILPSQGLVFVSNNAGRRVCELFDVMNDCTNPHYEEEESSCMVNERKSSGINYKLLKEGDTCETRYVLGKIIIETMRADDPPYEQDKMAKSKHLLLSSMFR
ncbi:hypothetical protein HPP92_020619 [Vanilla planifolia]|uniref:Uncharacterized protein n=1 Tax=Vanilla planifolia TaxID=51239 RepID=A0A835UI13_VANPL|nr:hypothetical protein HPP92_020619 [Vanilla planifolia]